MLTGAGVWHDPVIRKQYSIPTEPQPITTKTNIIRTITVKLLIEYLVTQTHNHESNHEGFIFRTYLKLETRLKQMILLPSQILLRALTVSALPRWLPSGKTCREEPWLYLYQYSCKHNFMLVTLKIPPWTNLLFAVLYLPYKTISL